MCVEFEKLIQALERSPKRISPQASLRSFREGKIPDKTFSQLIAKSMGLHVMLGIVIRIHEGHINEIYQIPVSSQAPLQPYENYCIRYDFREKFNSLEQWLLERPSRPKRTICVKNELPEKIRESINSGVRFQSSFFLLVQRLVKASDQMKSGLATVIQDKKVYIEVGPDIPSIAHKGLKSFCFTSDSISSLGENIGLTLRTIREITCMTRKITRLIGDGTVIEWIFNGNVLYLSSAQRSTKGCHTLSTTTSETLGAQENFRVASPGISEGYAIPLSENIASVRELTQKQRDYIFIGDSPQTGFSMLVPFARGFIFRRGSLLSHLVVLLREKGVPCIFLDNDHYVIEQGSKVHFDTYQKKLVIEKR